MEYVNTITDIIIRFGFEHQLLVMTILGGVFPAFIWMLFWVYEGECDEEPDPVTGVTYLCIPEPKSLLFLTFLAGGFAVLPTIILQKLLHPFFSGTDLIIVWATIEEIIKYSIFWLIDYKTGKLREAADALVYLSVVALGFSAVENSLFLFEALNGSTISNAFIGQNYRFLGASILHVLASGFIGICIGYTFFADVISKKIATILGILGAISLHSVFNYLIIIDSNTSGLSVPAIIWCIGIVYLLLIEGLRFLAKRHKRILYEEAHASIVSKI
jgi:RsiW-degrading membrane proteinase PrsW (M82 family)